MSFYRIRAYVLLLIVAVIWGVGGPVLKIVLGILPWYLFLLYRFLISTVIILPFIKKSDLAVFKKGKTAFLCFLYAFLISTLDLGLLFAGTAKTSLVSMSLIQLFGPILTIAAGYFFLKDRVTWIEKIGTGITFIGSLLIVLEPVLKFNGVQGEISGNIMVFGALVGATAAAVILKELLRKGIKPFFLANLTFVVGFLVMGMVTFLNQSAAAVWNTIYTLPLAYHAGVWYMAIFSGTIAYGISNLAQRSIEVSELAVFNYLYPIISTVLAVIILKEVITPLSYFGAGITMVGIFIAEVKRRSRH